LGVLGRSGAARMAGRRPEWKAPRQNVHNSSRRGLWMREFR
jgi:hypothetical protein